MKFLKYIAAALLLVAGLASCNGAGETGTVGKTTVQFAQAEIKAGFVDGVVYVPLTITADTEADMNTCAVQVKVKPVITGEQYEGTSDVNGIDGDYRITSCDMNFPAYGNYYDKNEPDKYYNEETKKWTREVNVEVLIVNTKPEEIHFTLEIESATTAIGEQKQCNVILKKDNRDRICGVYEVAFEGDPFWIGEEKKSYLADDAQIGSYFPADATKYTWTEVEIVWINDYGCFAIVGDNILSKLGLYFWGYYDDTDLDGDPDTDDGRMYFTKNEIMAGWEFENADDEDETNDVAVSALVHNLYDTEAGAWVEDRKTYWTFDVQNGVLALPENLALAVSVNKVINNSDIGEYLGDATPAYKGVVLTKTTAEK